MVWFGLWCLMLLSAKFGQILPRTDTRLVFCNRKLMRTDIFFTRTTKPICNFANSGMDYAISAQSRKLCITNKYKYKIHNKIYPIQHSARSGKRCIEVTNRDEYKNITTRNVFFPFAVHHGHRGLYDDTTNQLPFLS
jgi:hypothetical protein